MMTPNDAVKELIALGETQRLLLDEIQEADRARVIARAVFDVAYARCFLQSEGSVDARKAQSTIETRDEKVAAEFADVCYRNAVGRERKIKDDIGTYRTVSATLRSEYEHTA